MYRFLLFGVFLMGFAWPAGADETTAGGGPITQTPTQFNTARPLQHTNVLATDPLVTRAIARLRQTPAPAVVSAAPTPGLNASQVHARASSASAAAKTEIIKLEIPAELPPVVNRTKSFVFRDVTPRDGSKSSVTDDLQKRQQQIELLRRTALGN